MSIGVGVFLLAAGAILSFAVRDGVPGIDLVTIGYILMAAGGLTIVLSFVLAAQSRRRLSRPDDPYTRP